MIKVFGLFRIVGAGEWEQVVEIVNQGQVIGHVERVRTDFGRFTRTRNLQGDLMEGECLEWLLEQTA